MKSIRNKKPNNSCALIIFGVLLSTTNPSWSSNGMNAPGNGATQLGMAGAGTAMADDSFATLRNPAAAAWLEDGASFDLGIAVPKGGSKVGAVGPNSQFGLLDIEPGNYKAVKGIFPIPSYVRNWRLNSRSAIGWGVSASGLKSITDGGSASLARGFPPFAARCKGSFAGSQPLDATSDLMGLCGNSGQKLGVDLTQVVVSGNYAYRLTDSMSLGVAPVLAAQRFMARGLGAFSAFSNIPDKTTDNDFDYSYGGGLRLGMLWEISDGIGFGAAYQSKLYQTKFDRYKGMIVGGSVDFAPTINAGLQFHLAQGHRMFVDVEHIQNEAVKGLAQQTHPQRFSDGCFIPRLTARSANPEPLSSCLSGDNGPGFGWVDVTIYKLGYQVSKGRMAFRAGFSWGGNPEAEGQTLAKFFAPAISDKHAALGVSWNRARGGKIDVALFHAIENRIREHNAFSNVDVTVLGGNVVGYRVEADDQDQLIDSSIRVWQLHMTYSWTP